VAWTDELHRGIVEPPITERNEIEDVVLVELPGRNRALTWQSILRSLNVPRREVEERFFAKRRIVPAGNEPGETVLLHELEQPTEVLAREIAFQRPRRIRVSNDERQVGHVAQHHPLVDTTALRGDRRTVERQLDAAKELQLEPRRGDDEIR